MNITENAPKQQTEELPRRRQHRSSVRNLGGSKAKPNATKLESLESSTESQNWNPSDSCTRNAQKYLRVVRRFAKPVLKEGLSIEETMSNHLIKPFLQCIDTIENRIRCRGLQECIKWTKSSRNAYTQFLCGGEFANPLGIPLTKDGIPKWLSCVIDACERVNLAYAKRHRLILTILTVSRGFTLPEDIDVKPITDPYTGVPDCGITDKELKQAKRILDNHIRKKQTLPVGGFATKWDGFHLCTKAGPNGPSSDFSIFDSKLVSCQDQQMLTALAGRNLLERITHNRETVISNKEGTSAQSFEEMFTNVGMSGKAKKRLAKAREDPCLRRLSAVADKEGKTRVVAILDYWSQAALKRLHDSVLRYLKKIDQDLTYDQDSLEPGLLGSDMTQSYHSLDLTNATDRLPIQIQKRILKLFTSQSKSQAWEHLMTGLPFRVGRDPKRPPVCYTVGQPMGAHSSWPMLSLTHHLLVQVAALRARVSTSQYFDSYLVLGDDIVIHNDRVAGQYRKIMSDLGVEISPLKTHVSPYCFEFAKRWFWRGEEVSPFSFPGFISSKSSYALLSSFLLNQRLHGWFNTSSTDAKADYFAVFLDKVFRLHGHARRRRVELCRKSAIFICHLEYKRTKLFTGELGRLLGVSSSSELKTTPLWERRLYTQVKATDIKDCLNTVAEFLFSRGQTQPELFYAMYPDYDHLDYEKALRTGDPGFGFLDNLLEMTTPKLCDFMFADEANYSDSTLLDGAALAGTLALPSFYAQDAQSVKIAYEARMVTKLVKFVKQTRWWDLLFPVGNLLSTSITQDVDIIPLVDGDC